MAWADWSLTVVFGAWFLLTVVRQIGATFPTRVEWINAWFRSWDALSLIPVWTFFAPYPAVNDYHLLFRDKLEDGTFSPWTEIRLVLPRRWSHAVWNPGKREKKALYDAVALVRRDLAGLRAAGAPRTSIEVSLGYLALLNYVTHVPRSFPAAGVQFALMASNGAHPDAATLIFRSDIHRV